jgi:type IV pilus assembly protein PilA
MFQRFQALKEQREGGFTLIELLVVILIIAILVAIAIPVFLNQRNKGYVAQSQESTKDAAKAEESWVDTQVQDGGVVAYTDSLVDLRSEGFRDTNGVALTITHVGATTYCITATNNQLPAGHLWEVATYDSDDGRPTAANAC